MHGDRGYRGSGSRAGAALNQADASTSDRQADAAINSSQQDQLGTSIQRYTRNSCSGAAGRQRGNRPGAVLVPTSPGCSSVNGQTPRRFPAVGATAMRATCTAITPASITRRGRSELAPIYTLGGMV